MNMFDDKNLGHLPLDVLRTFVAAARHGSFTRAGRDVHRTQSAVSMQMKRLETELGRSLFVRTAREVHLTADGELLLGYAHRLLRLHDEALASFSGPQVAGEVRFGVPDDYASRYLTDILSRFAVACPQVRVDVRCDASPDLLRALAAGELDGCLATGEDGEEAGRGAVVARIPLVWMASRSFDARRIRQEGEPLPLAVFHEGCLHRKYGTRALDRAGIPWRVAFSSLSLAVIQAAVRTGLAVSPVARTSLEPDCMVLGPDEGMPGLPAVTAVLHGGKRAHDPAVAQLLRFVRECFETGPFSPGPA